MKAAIATATGVLALCLYTVSVSAQYNPYARENKVRAKPATAEPQSAAGQKAANPAKSKKATVGKKKPKQPVAPPPQVVEEITPSKAFGDDPEQQMALSDAKKIEALERELKAQRELLARAGILEGAESLSFEQREELGRLETRLQQVRANHQSLLAAIDGGLNPEVVMSNLHAMEAEMAEIHREIAVIRDGAGQGNESLSKQLKASDDRISELEEELSALRSQVNEDKKQKAAGELDEGDVSGRLNQLLPVEIFAFGDFMFHIQEDAPDDFAIGQLEMDVTQGLMKQLTITAAIAYDGDRESFGVGAFTIDGRLVGNDDSHLRISRRIDSLGIILGKFDVPFGIDYMEYASIDRRLVTGPIAVDGTHEGWNDLGAQVYLMMPRMNAVVYGVNGFGYSTVLSDVAGNEVEIEHPTAMALGGRIGLLPLEVLEVGGSAAGFFNADVHLEQMLVGGDLALSVHDFDVKGEYIFMKQGLDAASEMSTHGVYGGALYDFKPVFVTARYSMLWPHELDNQKQLSLGLGVAVLENAEVRLEYSTSLETGGSEVFIQLAGGTAWQPSGMRR